MKKDIKKAEATKKATDQLKELNAIGQMENLVKDNKIIFEVKGEEYRISKPNYKQKNDLMQARSKQYIIFLKDDTFLLKEQLVELYKKKGIDLDAIDIEVIKMQKRIEKVQVTLAPEKDEKSRELLKEEIQGLFFEQVVLIQKKTDYLSNCLENELLQFDNLYTVYLILEKKVKDKWIKVFDNYDTYLESDEDVINKALMNLPYLIANKQVGDEE